MMVLYTAVTDCLQNNVSTSALAGVRLRPAQWEASESVLYVQKQTCDKST